MTETRWVRNVEDLIGIFEGSGQYKVTKGRKKNTWNISEQYGNGLRVGSIDCSGEEPITTVEYDLDRRLDADYQVIDFRQLWAADEFRACFPSWKLHYKTSPPLSVVIAWAQNFMSELSSRVSEITCEMARDLRENPGIGGFRCYSGEERMETWKDYPPI